MRRKRFFKFFFFILSLSLIYIFIFKTEFFTVKNIEVIGNKKVNYNEVVKASKCRQGENIFKVDKKIGEKALKELIYVKEAKISRKFPENIVIEIEEREEIAAILYLEEFLLIDDEGYLLSRKDKEKNMDLPQIHALDLLNLEIGENIFDKIKNENIKDIIFLSNKAELLHLMQHINFSDEDNVTIELKNNIKVAFGPLNNVNYKVSFLSEILADIKEKDIKVKQIILNKGDNPIILLDEE